MGHDYLVCPNLNKYKNKSRQQVNDDWFNLHILQTWQEKLPENSERPTDLSFQQNNKAGGYNIKGLMSYNCVVEFQIPKG